VTLPALLAALLANLPELMRLIRLIARNIEEAQSERKIREDLIALNKAFESKDAEALRHIFMSGDSPDR